MRKRLSAVSFNKTFRIFSPMKVPKKTRYAIYELHGCGAIMHLVSEEEIVDFKDKNVVHIRTGGEVLVPAWLINTLQIEKLIEVTYKDDRTIYIEAYDNSACDICRRNHNTSLLFEKRICRECCLAAAGMLGSNYAGNSF